MKKRLIWTTITVAMLSAQAQQMQWQAPQAQTEAIQPAAQPQASNQVNLVNLVFIDTSKTSLEWLDKNHKFIIENNLPVMIINGTQQGATRLNQQYIGLKSGPSPKPDQFLQILLEQLNVKSIPAMVINGTVRRNNAQLPKPLSGAEYNQKYNQRRI